MSNHFLYACTFDSSDLPFDLHQTGCFFHVVLDFNYKLMFGGDRRIYFLNEKDELVILVSANEPVKIGTRGKRTTVHLIPMNTPFQKRTLTLDTNIWNFKSEYPHFHPTGFYRNLSDLYVVDMVNCDMILRLEPELKIFKFQSSKISKVISGPLGNCFLVQTTDKRLHNLKDGTTTSLDFNIAFGCSFGGGYIVVSEDKKVYVVDTSSYVLAGIKRLTSSIPSSETTSSSLQFVDLPELKKDVIDVKCGYYHAIFLTARGKVFVCGYDNMQQCSLGVVHHSESFCPLTELKIDYGFATKIGSFSRGNYVINQKNQVFFIAEMFADFSEKTHSLKFVQQFNLDTLNSECLKHDLHVYGTLNDVVTTGWQCCISHNPNFSHGKTLKYMLCNLKVLSQQDIGTISDISFQMN